MKFAILCNKENSFPLPMAKGLERMLTRIGEDSEVFTDGWKLIRAYQRTNKMFWVKKCVLFFLKQIQTIKLRRLKHFDAIIVVGHMPNAFRRHFIDRKLIHQCLGNLPVVLYDLVSLLDKQQWEQNLRKNKDHTLELYDHYLLISPIHNKQYPSHPSSTTIGIDLDDSLMHPEQKNFQVILDFDRSGYEENRRLQIKALELTETPYIQLRGQYSRETLMKLFRESAALFLSFPESFGLPVCEIQTCGGVVFCPNAGWVNMHQITSNRVGKPDFTPNFNFYSEKLDTLVSQIINLRENFNAEKNRLVFSCNQGLFLNGSTKALQEFVRKLRTKEIYFSRGEEFSNP